MDIKQQFKTKEDVQKFVFAYIPIAVRSNRTGKMHSPFTTLNAFNIVTETLTEAIWEKVVNQNQLTKTLIKQHLNDD